MPCFALVMGYKCNIILCIMLHVTETRSEMRLFDQSGNRLYLDAQERQAFLKAAREQECERRTFCEMLYFTGCEFRKPWRSLPSG